MALEDRAFLLLEELKRIKDGKIEQLSGEKERLAYGARHAPRAASGSQPPPPPPPPSPTPAPSAGLSLTRVPRRCGRLCFRLVTFLAPFVSTRTSIFHS